MMVFRLCSFGAILSQFFSHSETLLWHCLLYFYFSWFVGIRVCFRCVCAPGPLKSHCLYAQFCSLVHVQIEYHFVTFIFIDMCRWRLSKTKQWTSQKPLTGQLRKVIASKIKEQTERKRAKNNNNNNNSSKAKTQLSEYIKRGKRKSYK